MCNGAILQNGGTLESDPHRYETQEMCNKAVHYYGHALEFVPDRFKTQEMCIKAVDSYPSTIKYVPGQYKTQEMCIRALLIILLYLILFSIDTRSTKCVFEVLIIILLQ